jgi:hypothetical protein
MGIELATEAMWAIPLAGVRVTSLTCGLGTNHANSDPPDLMDL